MTCHSRRIVGYDAGAVQLPKRIRLPHETYAEPENVFHIVVHASPETRPFEDAALADAIWGLVLGERQRIATHLFAACLMPDHLHVLASPAKRGIVEWMDAFKSYSTRVSWEYRGMGVLWQPSYYDRRIRNPAELEATVAYILGNPEEAGLVG